MTDSRDEKTVQEICEKYGFVETYLVAGKRYQEIDPPEVEKALREAIKLTRDQQWITEPAREGLCDDCHQEYPTPWFAANPVWNAVCKDANFLCVHCFIKRADAAGYKCTGWELVPENANQPSREQQ